eukprot:CAMPEP_0114576320 /NCGR_PEP_ID=MMETSP0125-20121206/1104_1 /TAXON_ID=485358 ORGANISM="Aristerostoma sp., Strain ATCC 50986" /NCGR_SAMPLE_ID=MMETSP0125 /ASSEMBLY_ACC=CAM_ASM_000245 /LENGTH=137 /DNA_ID=CAMNT_0001764761 /DNA_START=199 /DNA_END=612 /DNA_ORIENTATION=-
MHNESHKISQTPTKIDDKQSHQNDTFFDKSSNSQKSSSFNNKSGAQTDKLLAAALKDKLGQPFGDEEKTFEDLEISSRREESVHYNVVEGQEILKDGPVVKNHEQNHDASYAHDASNLPIFKQHAKDEYPAFSKAEA